MDIQTKIELEHAATYAYTAEAAAAQCIAALGGNSADDTCVVTIIRRPESSIVWGIVFNAEIRLGGTDTLAYDANGCATQLLAALGGDPTKDTCLTTVSMDQAGGNAGLPYPPVQGGT